MNLGETLSYVYIKVDALSMVEVFELSEPCLTL